MDKRKFKPRACILTGMMFVTRHPGQLFCDRAAAEAFEESGYEVVILDPKHKPFLQRKVESLPNVDVA